MTRLMLAIALVVGTLMSLPSPMRATQEDCADALRWPSFAEVAPTARSIYLVRVTRSVDGIAEKARSVEVMKGAAPARIDLRTLRPGRTSDECLEPIGPFAQVGDRLLIAYDGTAPDRPGRIDAVAHVGRMRDGRNVSGLERLTFEEARIYDAPMTASPPPPRRPPPSRSYLLDAIRLAVEKPIRSVARHVLDVLQAAIVAGSSSMSRPTDPTAGVATDVPWSCGGDPPGFPGSAFTGPTGAETMDGPVFDGLRRALKTMRSEFRLEPREDRPHRLPWTLAYRDDDLAVFLVRRTRRPERFSAMYVEREGDRWRFGGYRDDCGARPLITHGLGNSNWRIDSGSPPASGSTSFPIEVMEHECASGRPAAGRIPDPIVEYGEDAITVIVPVRRVEGRSATCQGNPWTPFLLELAEPIGDRKLLDGGPWPPEQRWPTP